jgi:hypothetical protein
MIRIMADASTPPRRWLPRVTLFRFFAWLTVLTLLGSHVATSYRLRQAQREIEQLRQRAGEPPTIESNRLTAGVLVLPAPNQWRFRIHKPGGRKLVLRYALSDIEPFDLPDPRSTSELSYPTVTESGIIVINVAVVEKNGRAVLRVGHGTNNVMSTSSTTLPVDHFFARELRGETNGTTSMVLESALKPDSGRQGEPLVLLRLREQDGANDVAPSEGLILWVEDAP